MFKWYVEKLLYYIWKKRLFFDGHLSRFFILSTASFKHIFLQVILMDCCFSSLIRLSRYRSSQFMSQWEMSLSGILEIISNNKSSALLLKLWKNSFNQLQSLSSMSIVITPIMNNIRNTETFYKWYEISKKDCSRKHLISFTMDLLEKLPLKAWKFVHENKMPFLKRFSFFMEKLRV